MTLPYDYARCHGHPIQQCQDCQRRTETLHHPYRQSWMTVVFEDGVKCEHKIKETPTPPLPKPPKGAKP